jgi:hypothetical protein
MKAQARQQKQSSSPPPSAAKQRKDYDYNKPIGKCMICYTISGWHCYECDNDFCQMHFQDHKQKNLCTTT